MDVNDFRRNARDMIYLTACAVNGRLRNEAPVCPFDISPEKPHKIERHIRVGP